MAKWYDSWLKDDEKHMQVSSKAARARNRMAELRSAARTIDAEAGKIQKQQQRENALKNAPDMNNSRERIKYEIWKSRKNKDTGKEKWNGR